MGVYYFLINETKKERVEYDGHIKNGPMRRNEKVALAMMNYMMDNQNDHLTITSDIDCECYDEKYSEVDLSKAQTR